MKKTLIATLLIYSINVVAQNPTPKPEPDRKAIKRCLVFSGLNIVAGAITTTVKTYQIKPSETDPRIEHYREEQKSLTRLSSMFYGFAGAGLVTVCFNF